MPQTETDYRGKKVLVVGLGLHGGAVGAVRWLVRHGARVRVTDLKSADALAPSVRQLKGLPITWALGGHWLKDFLWADFIYQNQATPSDRIEVRKAKRAGKRIINETTIFFERCPSFIIGITGTRGKSTTTALLGSIMQRFRRDTVVTGNIRQTPMLATLDRLKKDQPVVVELSSFQLEHLLRVRRGPQIAVMTNVKIDHLNRYRTFLNYAKAKANIVRWQKVGDRAVLHYDDLTVRQAAKLTKASVLWYSTKREPAGHAVFLRQGFVVERQGKIIKKILPLRDWKLPGQHQRENLVAAVAAAVAYGVPAAKIAQAVRTFRGLPHRQALVRKWHGRAIINDTTATSPDGTLAALAVYPNAVFILGGSDKQLNFKPLITAFAKRHQPLVFLPGTATDLIWTGLQKKHWRGRHAFAASMPEAVRQAAGFAKTGQAIILSPGAASFGLFQHEFDRGEQFIRSVLRLP